MSRDPIAVAGIFAIAAALAVTAWQCSFSPAARFQGVKGVIDLRTWDPLTEQPVDLEGQWEFFPGQLSAEKLAGEAFFRSVPDLWMGSEAGGISGKGAGTYRLTVLLPENCPPLALRWTTVSNSAAFGVDGRIVGTAGCPALEPSAAVPQYNPQVAQFTPSGRQITLTVQVSNHEYRSGGLWRNIQLGLPLVLQRQKTAEAVVAFALMGAIVAVALSILLLFVSHPKRTVFLFFSIFAAVIGVRYVLIGDYVILTIFPGLRYDSLIRLEYASIGLGFSTFLLYTFRFFEGPPRLLAPLMIPEIVFLAFSLAAPISLLSRCQLPFIGVMVPVLAVFMAAVWWPALRAGKGGSRLIFIGVGIIVAASVHDIAIALSRKTAPAFIPWGFFAFVSIHAAAMVRQFNRTQRRAEAADKLVFRATYDPMTGLFNRASFFDRLAIFLSRHHLDGRAFGVALLDMDGLKGLNDRYGHHVGDEALKTLGTRLNRCGFAGGIAARLGGDEFALILPSVDTDEAVRAAESSILSCVEGPFEFEGATHFIKASVGVALCPSSGMDSDRLMKAADSRMYESKRRRKSDAGRDPAGGSR